MFQMSYEVSETHKAQVLIPIPNSHTKKVGMLVVLLISESCKN